MVYKIIISNTVTITSTTIYWSIIITVIIVTVNTIASKGFLTIIILKFRKSVIGLLFKEIWKSRTSFTGIIWTIIGYLWWLWWSYRKTITFINNREATTHISKVYIRIKVAIVSIYTIITTISINIVWIILSHCIIIWITMINTSIITVWVWIIIITTVTARYWIITINGIYIGKTIRMKILTRSTIFHIKFISYILWATYCITSFCNVSITIVIRTWIIDNIMIV